MRPCWITQDSDLSTLPPVFSPEASFHTLICCTASHRVEGSEGSEGGYIQGAGDDSEGWACGLTPEVFWGNRTLLMGTDEGDLEGLIQRLAEEWRDEDGGGVRKDNMVCVGGKGLVCVGALDSVIGSERNRRDEEGEVMIICGKRGICEAEEVEGGASVGTATRNKSRLHLNVPDGKMGSKALRLELPRLRPFLDAIIARNASLPIKVLCVCPTGEDLSIGVALVILCLYFDEDGKFSCPSLSFQDAPDSQPRPSQRIVGS